MDNVKFSDTAWEDYTYWQTHDPQTFIRLHELFEICLQSPHKGIGNPKPLKGNLSGWWSRRLTEKDHIIYKIEEGILVIAQARYRYS